MRIFRYNRENIQQKRDDSMRKLFKHTLFQRKRIIANKKKCSVIYQFYFEMAMCKLKIILTLLHSFKIFLLKRVWNIKI